MTHDDDCASKRGLLCTCYKKHTRVFLMRWRPATRYWFWRKISNRRRRNRHRRATDGRIQKT